MSKALVTVTRQSVEAVMSSILDDGASLREAVKRQGLTLGQFNHYLQSDRESALAVARAQEFRADVLVDEALHLADGDGDPAKVRNQISIRQWAAARFNQKRYGDRVDLNVTQTIDIGSTLQEARARMLSARYQQETIDVQAIDLPSESTSGASDKESLSGPPPVPDIFD